ncbi:unnamed protein product [Closterium sp. NIES-53]
MIEESGCQVHPGLPQGQAAWTRDEAKQQQNTGTPPVCPQGPKSTSSATRADAAEDAREGSVTTVARKRATVGLAARRESDSGSGRAGREDAGGDGNGIRRGAVEGRSAIWCVPGTAGGRGRLVRRLVQAGRAGDAGRDAGARRSARPPGGAGPGEGGRPRTCSRSGTKYGLGRGAPPEPAGTAPGLPARAPAPVAPPAPAAPAPVPSDGPAPAEPPAPTPPATPTPVAPAPPGQAPPEPVGAGVPPAPAARRQRRANHSRSSCGERTSRRDETPREATRADPAPPGSAPPGSVTPGSAPPGSVPSVAAPLGSAPPDSAPPGSAPPVPAPPGSAPSVSAPQGSAPPGSAPPVPAPPGSAPPDPAPAGSVPVAAPESTATSTGSTAST